MTENLFGVVTILVILLIAGLWGWKRHRELYEKFEEEEEDALESEDILNVEDEEDETVVETEVVTDVSEGDTVDVEPKVKRKARKNYGTKKNRNFKRHND